MNKAVAVGIAVLGVACAAILICLAVAWPFLWIWNFAVVSAMSVAKPLSYWPAFWLMVFLSAFVAGTAAGSSK